MERESIRVKIKDLYMLPEEKLSELRDRIIVSQDIEDSCVGYVSADITNLNDKIRIFGDSKETKELYFPIYVEKVESKYRNGTFHIMNPVTGDFIQKSQIETELRLIPFILHGIMKKPDEEVYNHIIPVIGDDQKEVYATMYRIVFDDSELCFLRSEITSDIVMTDDPYYAILLVDDGYENGPTYIDLFRVYLGNEESNEKPPEKTENTIPLSHSVTPFV